MNAQGRARLVLLCKRFSLPEPLRLLGRVDPLASSDEGCAQLQSDWQLEGGQLLLGHSKIEDTVRCLGVGLDDSLSLAEATEI